MRDAVISLRCHSSKYFTLYLFAYFLVSVPCLFLAPLTANRECINLIISPDWVYLNVIISPEWGGYLICAAAAVRHKHPERKGIHVSMMTIGFLMHAAFLVKAFKLPCASLGFVLPQLMFLAFSAWWTVSYFLNPPDLHTQKRLNWRNFWWPLLTCGVFQFGSLKLLDGYACRRNLSLLSKISADIVSHTYDVEMREGSFDPALEALRQTWTPSFTWKFQALGYFIVFCALVLFFFLCQDAVKELGAQKINDESLPG